MNDTQKSAWGGNLISRRRMLHYGLAGMAGIARGFWPLLAFGKTTSMSGTNNMCFTYEMLVMIRQNLLEVLKRQEANYDYAHLISEIETGNAQPMISADSVHIGRWNLIHRNEKWILETQRIQHNKPIRLTYTAPIEWRDGRWKVLSVHIKTVIRR